MKKVVEIVIDKTEFNGEDIYRYHIEFDDGSSHGSCFCHMDLETCVDQMRYALKLEQQIYGGIL